MVKTMTIGELINILSIYPPHMPIFFYDADKERDSMIEVVELAGPISDVEETGDVSWSTPYYCKGVSNIEDHWQTNGMCPILCMREKTLWERKEDDSQRTESKSC